MGERIVEMISAETIAARAKELGEQINADYQDKSLVVVPVLKGSFMFTADLVRHITVPMRMDFLAVRSYGEGTESTGVVQIVNDLTKPIAGEDVLIVEDIVDTGLTIAYLMDLLRTRNPRSVKICSLLYKPARARVHVNVDYIGFTIEDKFVVGYGLDYAEKLRNLPFVGVVEHV